MIATTTDAIGAFRFPSLPPGNYKVTATSRVRRPRSRRRARGLGQIKKVDFSLPLSGVTETVQVTAESPLDRRAQSARQTNIRAEQIELLPQGRDFTTLVTQAPGANQESEAGRHLDRRRQRRREPLHHRRRGDHRPADRPVRHEHQSPTSSKKFRSSRAASPPSSAARPGGVISAVTRAAPTTSRRRLFNNFLKAVSRSTTPRRRRRCRHQRLTRSQRTRRELRLLLNGENQAETVAIDKDDYSRWEPPSARRSDRQGQLWFCGAYAPAIDDDQRARSPSAATADRDVRHRRRRRSTFAGNVTWQLARHVAPARRRTTTALTQEGLLPALNGTRTRSPRFASSASRPRT